MIRGRRSIAWQRAAAAGALSLLLACPAAGVCTSTKACLRAIDTAQSGTRSVTAKFVQTKHLALLDEPLVSTGRFLFKRPDRMRLEIESPRPATIVINGRQVSIPGLSESDRKQLAMTPMTTMFTELGAIFSGSPAALEKHFEISASSRDDAIDLTLTPAEPDWQRLFRTIAIRFAGPDLVVDSMRLDDPLGDRLEIQMSDVQRNVDIADSAFTIPTPAPQ